MKFRLWTAAALLFLAGEVVAQDLGSLYKSGTEYGQFLDDAVARRAMWLANTEKADVPDELLVRARAIGGSWHLLAVAVDACSDSANILPYLSALVANVDGLEMRIVHPDKGQWIMDANKTSDGRAATPTIVLLDGDLADAGVFVERPAELQKWALENKSAMNSRDFLREKFAWYDADAGRETIREIVELMERAAVVRSTE